MSVYLKPGQLKIKDENGDYTGINAVALESTAEYLAEMEAKGDQIMDDIETKGEETLESIPDDYTALSEEVSELNERFITETKSYQNNGSGVSEVLFAVTWTNGSTFNDDGTTTSNGSYKISDYIPITGLNYNLITNNPDSAGRVFRIIGYDANKQNPVLVWKKSYSANADYASNKISIFGCSYIRISYAKTATISMFDSIITLKDEITNASGQQLFNGYQENYYVGPDGSLVNLDSYSTDYIPVNYGDTIEIKNGYFTANRSICLYDASKNFIEFVYGNGSVTDLLFVVMNPSAKYLRSTFLNPNSFSCVKLLNDRELIRTTVSDRYYEKGAFTSTGDPTANSNYVRMKGYVDKNVNAIYINGDYYLGLIVYNKIGTFVSRSYWHGDDKGRFIPLDHSQYKYKAYIRQKVQSATITTADASVNIYYLVGFKYYNKQLDNLKLFENRSFDIGLANADNPMPLVTYYGDNQIVHPKVLYFPNKFGGHKYWMAYTPYPGGAVAYENPCIAYSDDGYGWENINGNPIASQPTPGSLTDYNSDTHLVYRSDLNRLECWYRYCEELSGLETVVRKTSTDGVTWGQAEELRRIIHQGTFQSETLSPAVFYEDDKYKIWCVSKTNGEHIEYFESTDGTDWQFVRSISLSFEYDGETYYPWHMDCIKDNNKYVMLIMCKGNTGIQWPLFIATSSDNITYNTPYPVLLGSDAGWDTDMYRSSIVNVEGTYFIYYSARNHSASAGYKYGLSISTSPVLKHFKGTQEYN